ncbi:hypothetical protein [Methylobacterium nigriterrae]|uniref:hypothetical protein n=1 Tax=Methylobacterium nigriterrae TaxID=3127512 RepID=UPI003013C1AF
MWLAGLAWVAVGTWAEARREIHQEDSPVLVAGIEADLAGRHCAGLKIDVERFRGFAHEHAMTHADFFMKKRSRRLKQDIANTLDQLRRAPQPTCDRLWADYGNASRKVQLLKRV